MASAILICAKRGAYLAIGLYVTLVLIVSLGTQYQNVAEPSLQASAVSVTHAVAKGAAGA
ncbi:hypothetical protein [Pseudomonas sp. D1-2]|uniref:hypothetical protein n=1 Tax=unclassified Pseudomonas TaxID=196821 RepID=UPI003DA9A8EC